MSLTVTAIVPAFNEEKRIRNVLAFLAQSSLLAEVICVDDGSTDGTNEIIRTIPGVTCISLPINQGKANAIVEGILAAKSDCILFIDADLKGLTDKTLYTLIEPLASGIYDVSVGSPTKIEDVTVFRPLTGERCYFRKDLLPHVEDLRAKGYGLELTLNYMFRDKRVKFSWLRGVSQLHKARKYDMRTSIKREYGTWKELAGEVSSHDRPLAFTYGAYVKHFYVRARSKR